MKAIACAIIVHSLLTNRDRSKPLAWQYAFHILGMEMLMGYFLFWG